MNKSVKNMTILMADGDEEDCMMTLQSLRENNITNEIYFLHNADRLFKCLRKEAPYENLPRPDILLLDINLPRLDCKDALQKIKADTELCSIPIVVLLASHVEEDILKSHELDVDGFLVKPINCERLIELMEETTHCFLKQAS